MTSRHGFTTYLYHRPTDASHVCSPDRGHAYDVTVALTAPAHLLAGDQGLALRVAVAELDRDLQYRELERIGDKDVAVTTWPDLARWIHAAIARSLADGLYDRLTVSVEAPATGAGTAIFPSPA